MQVLTSRTQVAHEQQCFLAHLQISLTPKPLSGWVLIALFSAHFHNFQALKALACSRSSDCPHGLLHAFAPSDADGCDGATHLTPCYHPYPSPGSNPGLCAVADFDTELVPRLAPLDCMSVIVSPLPLFRRQGSEPTDLKNHLAYQALAPDDKSGGHRLQSPWTGYYPWPALPQSHGLDTATHSAPPCRNPESRPGRMK